MFSLIIPVFRNETSIPRLVETLADLNRRMDGDFEAVLVVDGSPDQSAELLSSILPNVGFLSQLIILSRNFGSSRQSQPDWPRRGGSRLLPPTPPARQECVVPGAKAQVSPGQYFRLFRSSDPLVESAWPGGLDASLVLAVIVVFYKLSGRIAVPGYAAKVLLVMFFGGLNSFGLGLIGEYMWRAFENTKGRPTYVVARQHQFKGEKKLDG